MILYIVSHVVEDFIATPDKYVKEMVEYLREWEKETPKDSSTINKIVEKLKEVETLIDSL